MRCQQKTKGLFLQILLQRQPFPFARFVMIKN